MARVMLYQYSGSESSVLNGDPFPENRLCSTFGCPAPRNSRNVAVESMYEYGSRVGIWRLLDLFRSKKFPATVFACGKALEMNPSASRAMVNQGWEMASHGYRWLDYNDANFSCREREDIEATITKQTESCGYRPIGFYQGKPSAATRNMVVEKQFIYDNDSYGDDCPYWSTYYSHDKRHGQRPVMPLLILPYNLDTNDMGLTAEEFGNMLIDCAQQSLADDGVWMMTIGLHPRIIARPHHISGLIKFMDYVSLHSYSMKVVRRMDIARFWYSEMYPPAATPTDQEWRTRLGDKLELPSFVKEFLNVETETYLDNFKKTTA